MLEGMFTPRDRTTNHSNGIYCFRGFYRFDELRKRLAKFDATLENDFEGTLLTDMRSAITNITPVHGQLPSYKSNGFLNYTSDFVNEGDPKQYNGDETGNVYKLIVDLEIILAFLKISKSIFRLWKRPRYYLLKEVYELSNHFGILDILFVHMAKSEHANLGIWEMYTQTTSTSTSPPRLSTSAARATTKSTTTVQHVTPTIAHSAENKDEIIIIAKFFPQPKRNIYRPPTAPPFIRVNLEDWD